MTVQRWLVVGGTLALLTALGCNRSRDTSAVLASVGKEKVTQKMVEDQIRALAPNAEDAKEFLSDAKKEERKAFTDRIVQMKAMIAFAKLEGLDKDPKAQILVEQALANAYMQIMMDRRISALKPTEQQLKAYYDELVASAKSKGGPMGGAIPPFEAVKEQLTGSWKQNQAPSIQKSLLSEMEQKVKVVKAK